MSKTPRCNTCRFYQGSWQENTDDGGDDLQDIVSVSDGNLSIYQKPHQHDDDNPLFDSAECGAIEENSHQLYHVINGKIEESAKIYETKDLVRSAALGTCRINPPAPGAVVAEDLGGMQRVTGASWVIVDGKEDWCGQHEPIPAARKTRKSKD